MKIDVIIRSQRWSYTQAETFSFSVNH